MKNILTALLCILYIVPVSAQKNRCSELIDRVVKNYDSANGISANFTLKTYSNGYESNISGKILMDGDMFYFVTPEMECGYDGHTLWSYIKSNEEVNLSIPDAEEITSINPYLIFKGYNNNYTCSYNGKSASDEAITLTPKKSDSNIASVKVNINNKLVYPTKIVIINKDKTETSINISNYNSQIKIDKKQFSFNKDNFKNIEIIDLR